MPESRFVTPDAEVFYVRGRMLQWIEGMPPRNSQNDLIAYVVLLNNQGEERPYAVSSVETAEDSGTLVRTFMLRTLGTRGKTLRQRQRNRDRRLGFESVFFDDRSGLQLFSAPEELDCTLGSSHVFASVPDSAYQPIYMTYYCAHGESDVSAVEKWINCLEI